MWRIVSTLTFNSLCLYKVIVPKTITKHKDQEIEPRFKKGSSKESRQSFQIFFGPLHKRMGRGGKRWTLLERGITSTTTTYRLYYLIHTHLAEATTLCYMSKSNVGIWGAILGIESILCWYNEEVFLMLKWVKWSVTNWSDLCLKVKWSQICRVPRHVIFILNLFDFFWHMILENFLAHTME